LGIGVPGLVEIEKGRTLFLPNLPTQWRGIEVAAPLATRLGCPVSLLNDARMAALGELRFGAGKDDDDLTFVFFTLGTGVGGGIAIDGKLRLGPLGAAAELGHQMILPDGPRCGCGSRGCLETLASGPALIGKGAWLVKCGRAPILRDRIEGDLNRLTPFEMAAAAEEGDEAVEEVLIEAARYIGIGAANVITAIHPELVVLGGGVAKLGDVLFDTVRQTVKERVGMFPTDDIRIEPSQLGDKAGVWGGLALARDACANSQ
jgi:glucokinase